MNKLQKYLKLVSQKFGTLQFPSPNGLGFQVKKLVVTNLKVGKKHFFFFISLLGLFSPEPSRWINNGGSSMVELAECFYIFWDAINGRIYNRRCNAAVLIELQTIFPLKLFQNVAKAQMLLYPVISVVIACLKPSEATVI